MTEMTYNVLSGTLNSTIPYHTTNERWNIAPHYHHYNQRLTFFSTEVNNFFINIWSLWEAV